ncbi:MAG: hypothetical protein HRU19_16415 [Pseudobacteriovorax sp.]|nr:hypothetical protein [Pseudobacteriovorax sp.]
MRYLSIAGSILLVSCKLVSSGDTRTSASFKPSDKKASSSDKEGDTTTVGDDKKTDQTGGTGLLPDLSEVLNAGLSSRREIKALYKEMDDEAFQSKWNASLETPASFFQSFAKVWYQDLKTVSDMPATGMCLGDPHPESFGTVWFSDGFRYVYQQLDDVGSCPVAFDILRYLVAANLTLEDPDALKQLIDTYLSEVKSPTFSLSIPDKFMGDIDSKRTEILEQTVDREDFRTDNSDLKSLSNDEKREIREALESHFNDPTIDVLDVIQRLRDDRGNAGVLSYNALIDDPNHNGMEVVELSQLLDPVVAMLVESQKDDTNRLKQAVDVIWGSGSDAVHFGSLKINGDDFLMRSRSRYHVTMSTLTKGEQLELMKLQVTMIAQVHGDLVNTDEALAWLLTATTIMSERYLSLHNSHK